MNWSTDPRIKKLLERATLENLFSKSLRKGRNPGNGERVKKRSRQMFIENKENDAEWLLNECLDTLCGKTLNRGKNHTPEGLLTLAKLFIMVGDFRLACDVIWCCASLTIQEFITTRGLKVRLCTQDSKRRFARALAKSFAVFEACHSSFYSNTHDLSDVNAAFEDANDFIRCLRTFELSNEKKNELEKDDFN